VKRCARDHAQTATLDQTTITAAWAFIFSGTRSARVPRLYVLYPRAHGIDHIETRRAAIERTSLMYSAMRPHRGMAARVGPRDQGFSGSEGGPRTCSGATMPTAKPPSARR